MVPETRSPVTASGRCAAQLTVQPPFLSRSPASEGSDRLRRVTRLIVIGIGVAIASAVLAGSVLTSMARAGTNGQQIEVYAPTQHSVRVCGSNQWNHNVCHLWNTGGSSLWYPLPNWWWKGSVSLENYAFYGGRWYLDTTSCNVPSDQAGDWTYCRGFSYVSAYDDNVDHPEFLRFSIPRMGGSWGIMSLAFFISAAQIGPLGTGFGNDRPFASNGFARRVLPRWRSSSISDWASV